MIIGCKQFGDHVDITDPCYNSDVWCRLNGIKIVPGEYTCVAWMSNQGEFGLRVSRAGIYLNGRIPEDREMEDIGDIGVDAGMAGFFVDKPNYNDEGWARICDCAQTGNAWIVDEGFFTLSGFGDGSYPVYAKKDKNGAATALEIHFL